MWKKLITAACFSTLPFMTVLLGGMAIGGESDAQADTKVAAPDPQGHEWGEWREERSERHEEWREHREECHGWHCFSGAQANPGARTTQPPVWEMR